MHGDDEEATCVVVPDVIAGLLCDIKGAGDFPSPHRKCFGAQNGFCKRSTFVLLVKRIGGIGIAPLQHPQLTDGFLAINTVFKFRV